jgi:hypothetical protein
MVVIGCREMALAAACVIRVWAGEGMAKCTGSTKGKQWVLRLQQHDVGAVLLFSSAKPAAAGIVQPPAEYVAYLLKYIPRCLWTHTTRRSTDSHLADRI